VSLQLTPEQEALAAELTHLQRMTVIHYIGGEISQRAAYYAAGGKATNDESADAIVSRMLGEAKVRAFYESLVSGAANSAVMSRQEALERLSTVARTDLADLVEFGSYEVGSEDGQPVIQATWKIKDSVLQDKQKMALISELSAGRDGIKIKTHSPLQAIQQLAKMQGWESASKHEITGKNGGPIQTSAIDASKLSTSALAEILAAQDQSEK
jgi:phage terminase small subunit